jgi:lactoylglutathione lyase
MKITGIAHNAIKVLDMYKALDFYCSAVGMTKAFVLPEKGPPGIIYVKISKNNFVEFFFGGEKDRNENYGPGLIGYHHWCVHVTNLQALRDRIFEKGYLKDDIQPKPTEAGGKNMWIHDPDGNALEILQPLPDSEYKGRDEFLGIGHVGYVVSDVSKSLDFYCDKLGLKQIRTVERDGKPWITHVAALESSNGKEGFDGQEIELFWNGSRTRPNTWESYGGTHLCLACDDVPNMVEDLRRRGVAIDIETKVGGDKNTQAWVHDPDGNRIELMQIHPDSPQARA